MKPLPLLWFFLLILSLKGWAGPSLEGELSASLDRVLESAVDEGRVAGATVIVAHRGQILYRQAAGFANLEEQHPMTVDTVFRLASVSKPMVSFVAVKLIEEGLLQLDDPVSRWLPDFHPPLDQEPSSELTVHHLLTHTSGLSYRFDEPKESLYHAMGVSDGLDNPALSLQENLKRLSRIPLLEAPGTKFRYSLSTDVLGAVIQSATQQSLPEAVESRLLGPLEMADTGFYAKQPHRLATPYANTKTGLVQVVDGTTLPMGDGVISVFPSKAFSLNEYPSGGGGMVGTADDFLKFLEMVRQNRGDLLSPTQLTLMKNDHLGSLDGPGPGWGFGYGWAVLRDPIAANTPQSRGTLLWGGAYGHSWFIDPEQELTVVLFTNTSFEGMIGKLRTDVRNTVYEWVRSPR